MTADPRSTFLEAAVWHGKLDKATALLAQHPHLAAADIHTAAAVGNETRVRHFIAADPASVHATDGPFNATPLVYLCLSKYLRLEPSRAAEFLRTATALLDAGADPNAGFMRNGEWETALYGAAGVAHHAAMTRLLLERGAIPDDEVIYHAAEEYDLEAMKVLVKSGLVTDSQRTLLLLRKSDWHDYEGIKWLLENGTSARDSWKGEHTVLGHALRSDNSLKIIQTLLDHGADPNEREKGRSAIVLAARAGRTDVLTEFVARGYPIDLHGVDKLIGACVMDDSARVREIAAREPHLVQELLGEGGHLLLTFAGTENTPAVRQLLDLGVDAAALSAEGNGYFGIAPQSTALHAAAWRAAHSSVKLLIERGAPVNARDGQGRTALQLAVLACVESYWMARRSPESVRLLLEAGATTEGVRYPSGYDQIDVLLVRYAIKRN